MKLISAAILVFLTALCTRSGAEYCDLDDDLFNYKETWCEDGCCFDECCDLDLDNHHLPAIVGGCVGAFLFVVLVISLICACVKSGTRQGRVVTVVSPAVVSTMAVTSTANGGVAGYGMYSSNVQQPPAYY